MVKNSRRFLSLFLSLLMIVGMLIVPLSVTSYALTGAHSQTHISNVNNSTVASSYIKGYAVPLDGTNGTPNLIVPGLSQTDNMVPQGFTYYKEKNWVLVSSYSQGSDPTAIYALDFATGELKAQYNLYTDTSLSTPCTVHAGGIATSENNLYIALSGSYIGYIPLSELTEGVKNVGIAEKTSIGSVMDDANTSYASFSNGVLWTGNFYHGSAKDESLNKKANSAYNSLVLGYDVSGESNSADEWTKFKSYATGATASYIIAVPNTVLKIQCATVENNKLYIGTSYGRTNDSNLYIYNVNLESDPSVSLTVNGKTTKGYKPTELNNYTYIPMTEGMFVEHGIMYNIFESAAWYYNGYDSSSVSKNPTDCVWKIDVNALAGIDAPAFDTDAETNAPVNVNSGLTIEAVASSNMEPVTRVMYQGSTNKINAVYYASEKADGTLVTDDSYYEKDFFYIKATNHSNEKISVSSIKNNISSGTKALSITGGDSSAVIESGQSKLYKVSMTGTGSAGDYNFEATYTMDGLSSIGSASSSHTALTSIRIVNEPSSAGSTSNFTRYYYDNNEYISLTLYGKNTGKSYVYPTIRSVVKYSTPADISRNMDKNFSTSADPETTSTVSSSVDTSTFSSSVAERNIYYNVNGAKYTNLLQTGIIWKIGVWDKSANDGSQVFCHNVWTEGFGTSTSKTTQTQYPAFHVNDGSDLDDVQGATVIGPTESTIKTTYLYGNLNSDYKVHEINNTFRAWNSASRRASRVEGSVTAKINYFNASELETLFNKCITTGFVSGRYTDAKWTAYKTALQNAADGIGAYGQTQETLDGKYADLKKAYDALMSTEAATYKSQVYGVKHNLYKGKAASGTADNTFVKYYLVNSGSTFSPEYIDDSISEGYTLSLSNKIDVRSAAPSIKAVANVSGVNTDTAISYYANKYTVEFKNYNSSVLSSSEYFYSETPAYTGTPVRESDATNHYTFSGWDKSISQVTADTVYIAQYTAGEHEFTDEETLPATCTSKGVTTYTCDCGYSYSLENIDMKAHTPVSANNAVNPGCETEGKESDIICEVCNTLITEGAKKEAAGHTPAEPVEENKVDSTCSAEGSYDEVVYCSVCETEMSRTSKTIEKKAHIEVTLDAVESTCTATGLTEGKKCSVCDEILVAQTVTDKKAHTPVSAENAVNPGCETEGKESDIICDVCKTVLTEGAKKEAAGHTPAEPVEENKVDSTCSAEGSYDEVVYCSVCKTEMSRTSKTIDKKAHTEVTLEAVESTCTATGLTEGKKCSVCDEILVAQTVTDKKPHTPVSANNAVNPGCETEGKESDTICDVCKTVLTEGAKKEATGHTPAAAVEENKVDSTCKDEGSYDEVVYCSVCEEEISRTSKTIEKKAHTEVTLEAVESTCTATGLTEGKKCSVCEEVLVAQTVTEKKSHSYIDTVTKPTCLTDGFTTHVCNTCNDTYTDSVIKAPGHTATDAVEENKVDSTCKVEGSFYEVVYCSVCNTEMSRTSKTIDKKAHTEVTLEAIESTCTATGLTEGKKCSVCDEILVAQTVTDKKAHTPVSANNGINVTCEADGKEADTVCDVCKNLITEGAVIKSNGHTPEAAVEENKVDSTCKDEGSYDEVVYCSVCEEEISRTPKTIEKKAHTEVTLEAVESTCTATGLTEGKKCSVCEEVLVAQTVTDKKAHTPVSANNGINVTCEADGKEADTICDVCKNLITEGAVIKSNGHTPAAEVEENKVDSTCSAEGSYDEVIYCSVCNSEMSRTSKIIEKKAHKEVTLDAVESTCTATGLTEGKKCSVCEEVLAAQTVTDKKAHTPVSADNAVEVTCISDGKEADIICEVCKTLITEGKVIPSEGNHVPGEAVEENKVDASCTVEGSYDEVVYCKACSEEISRTPKTIEKTAHTEVILEAVESTCEKAGLTEGKKCSVCGEILVAQTTTGIKDHMPVSAENGFDAVCGKAGMTSDTICSMCHKVLAIGSLIPALEHEWVEKAAEKAPTCAVAGSTAIYECKKCNATKGGDPIEKLPHTEEVISAVEATCLTTGLTEGMKCTVCGTITVAQEVVEKGEHNYVEKNAEAINCKEEKVTYECDICYDTYTTTISRDNDKHDYKLKFIVVTTCTVDGSNTYECKDCGFKYTEVYETAPGHVDSNNDGHCDVCETAPGASDGAGCSHICHQKGLMGIIWKVINLLNKLFKINPVCECGVAHY